jgi:hypothetical protein
VSAAKPEVSIAYKNVAYTEAPQLVLYVDSQNLGAGQSVKVMFYDEEPKAVVYDAAAAKDPVSKIEYSGKEYDAFYSEPCAPARIRVDIYAVALVVDSEGNIVTKSDVLKYNVFEYAMDRFSMSPTADQTALYTALLDFAASVQDVFYTENNIDTVGGWADAYYGIKLQHVVEGKVTDSTAYYSRKVGNETGDDKEKTARTGQYSLYPVHTAEYITLESRRNAEYTYKRSDDYQSYLDKSGIAFKKHYGIQSENVRNDKRTYRKLR